jgi:hypothetical protein
VIYKSGDRVLVNSVPLFTIGALSPEPSTAGNPRRFRFRLPFVLARPKLSYTLRSFCFDFNSTVRDAREVISDITGLTFPPHVLHYQKHALLDDEFLFDIGYDDSRPIEVQIPLAGTSEVRVMRSDLKPGVSVRVQMDDTVHDVKSRLSDECGFPTDIELVYLGKVLYDDDPLEPGTVGRDRYLWCYPRIDEEIILEAPEVATTFEFLVTRTHARHSLPFVEGKTVREVKLELSKKLLKPMAEIAIIDLSGPMLLQDSDILSQYQQGRKPFNVHFVDTDQELTPDQIRLVQKFMPGKDPDTEGRELFLACASNARVFQKTCKVRGFI